MPIVLPGSPFIVNGEYFTNNTADGYVRVPTMPAVVTSSNSESIGADENWTIGNMVPLVVDQQGHLQVDIQDSNDVGIYVADSASNDAFSRLRVSEPTTLFDSQQQYGNDATLWDTQLTGSGAAITNLYNESTVQMTTGATTSGNSVIRQTKIYHRYQPAKSQLVSMTFVFDGGAVTNVTRRIGYFDGYNGIYLEQAGSTVNIVQRSYVSGSVVETRVAQSSWNQDKFNGTDPSGITLDLTKTNILIIDLQWLGVGRVRVGFDIGGQIIYAHYFSNANSLSTVYMTTANLPIRAELTNTGTAGGTATMRQICCAVASEGGAQYGRAKQFSANNGGGGASFSSGARTPLMSLQAAATGPNSVTNTGQITPKSIYVNVTGLNDIFWELVLNPTLSGASFASYNSGYSIANIDTSASSLTGGFVIDSGYLSASSSFKGIQSTEILKDLILSHSTLSGSQDILTLVVTAEGGSSKCFGSMTWLELW